MVRRVIVALAGRRIDPGDATVRRFPLESVPLVTTRLERLFGEHKPVMMVSSAACGADLIALDCAARLGMDYRIILPFQPATFRQTSVSDRPDERWGPLFDRFVRSAKRDRALVVLESSATVAEAYRRASEAILSEAKALSNAKGAEPVAVLVWEGTSRGANDLTADFAASAYDYGFKTYTVSTL